MVQVYWPFIILYQASNLGGGTGLKNITKKENVPISFRLIKVKKAMVYAKNSFCLQKPNSFEQSDTVFTRKLKKFLDVLYIFNKYTLMCFRYKNGLHFLNGDIFLRSKVQSNSKSP